MAKKYTVQYDTVLDTPSDPNTMVVDEQIDLAVLLSQRLQKQIRQGRNFQLKSVQCHLTPQGGDLDVGVAFSGQLRFCPTTKNSARAWRHAFSVWRKQKSQLINGIGPSVRYDDFEVAYDSDLIDSTRTSHLYASGINDDTYEHVCIYGSSTADDDVTLEDIFESGQPQHSPSRFPISNNVVKPSKFTSEFPTTTRIPLSCHWSASEEEMGALGSNVPMGATISSPKQYMNEPVLCGILALKGWMLPENVAASTQDDLVLTITMEVSIGSSLASTSRKYSKRNSRRALAGSRSHPRNKTKKSWWKYRKSR